MLCKMAALGRQAQTHKREARIPAGKAHVPYDGMVRNITHYEKRPIGKSAIFSKLSVESDGRNLIWISWMVISIYLLGLLYAMPLYALLYLKSCAGQSWRSAIAMASAMGFILYALSVHVLGKTLYGGQLWIWIGWLHPLEIIKG